MQHNAQRNWSNTMQYSHENVTVQTKQLVQHSHTERADNISQHCIVVMYITEKDNGWFSPRGHVITRSPK